MATIGNSSFNTIITGTASDDYILNHDSDRVTIDAKDGNDIIENFVDTRYYHGMNVSINAGIGNDTIDNGGTFHVGGSFVTIDGGEGDDSIYSNGVHARIYAGDGNDTIRNGGSSDIEYYQRGSFAKIYGETGNDYIVNWSGSNVTIDGGDGDDTISGGSSILGGAGNDKLYGGYSSVSIDGGDGDDTISGGNSVLGGAGNDVISNGVFSANINAGEGEDLIQLYSNNSTITGGKGNDTIYMNSATTIGNVYVYNSGDGDDIIYNVTEYDTISINGMKYRRSMVGSDVVLNLTDGGAITLFSAANTAVNIEENIDESTSVENTLDNRIIYGTDGADALYNVGGNNVQIYGLAGDDKLGNNYTAKSIDDSIIVWCGENVSLNGGTGNDEIYSSSPTDHIIYAAGDGNDTIVTYHSARDYSNSGSLKIHLTSGTFKGAKLDSRHHSNLILSVGNGTITLKTGSGLTASQIPITVIDSSGNEFNFTGEYEVKSFETAVRAGRTHTAERHDNYSGELVTSNNGSAFIEEGDTLKTDSSGNITEIIISDKNHKITTPLNRTAPTNVVVKDSAGNTIATIRYGVTDIYWDGNGYVIEAVDKTAPLAVESAMDNVRIIGSNRADNITSNGKNSVVDSGLGDDSVTAADSTSTVVGGLDNDTIYGSGEHIKLTAGSVRNASLNGNDVIITTSRADKIITVKNAKGKNITIANGKNKNLQFTLSNAGDTYGDPEVFIEEAEFIAGTARDELEKEVAAIMETTASTTSKEALDTLKDCFAMVPGSTLKLDDLPENVFSHIANDIYNRTDASRIGKFNILKPETWVYNVAEAISTLGATETSVGGYNISINSLIAMGAGSAYITVTNGSKKWEITFQSSKKQLADAIANYATVLNELNKDAWWNVITGLITDLTGTKKPGKYLTYAKNIVSALVDPDGNLSDEIKNVIKKELDITIDGTALRDFIKNYVPAPHNDIILMAADSYKEIKLLQASIKADKNFKENAEVYDNLNAAYSAFRAALNGTKVSAPQLSSFGFSGLFAGLKSSAVENINDEDSQITYVDASGETVASSTNAIGKFETDSDTLIYTALNPDAQDINLGSMFDTNDWLIKTSDESDKIITASNKNATVISGNGDDSIIVSGTGDVFIEAGSGNDVVRITSTAQSIMTVNGGSGNDTIYSNNGSNVFMYQAGDGDDVIYDYNEYNEIQIGENNYSTMTSGKDVIIQIGDGSISLVDAKDKLLNIKGTPADDEDTLPAGISISSATLTASTIFTGNSIDLADYASTVTKVNASELSRGVSILGTAAINSLKGGKGADTISGGVGNDTVSLGGGNDIYIYSGGNDLIQDYTTSADKIKLSGTSITSASISGFNVVLKTSTGNLTVKNGKGNNITIIDVAGNETSQIYPSGAPEPTLSSDLTYDTKKTAVTLTSGFTGTLKATDYASTVKKIDAIKVSTPINIIGNAQANTILGSSKAETIYGGIGNDSIKGAAGNDRLYGDAGADTLYGGTGADTLTGGDGKDVFVYSNGDGADVIADFTAGQDSIKLTSGTISSASLKGSDMVLKIGNGSLTVKNGKGKEISVGSAIYYNNFVYDTKKTAVTLASGFSGSLKVADYASTVKKIDASAVSKSVNLVGNSQANTIIGGSKAETIYGGTGNDSINGGAGNDKLYGDAGNDKLLGGDGADTLFGGAGADTLTGGDGKDVFVYANGDGADVITDFTASQDSIKLTSGTVASASLTGSDMVLKIGSGSLTVKNGKGKEISVGSAIYFNNFVYDAKKTAVTLASGFTGSLKAADYSSTVKKIDASAVSKSVNLVGNAQANTIIGSSKAETIYGGKGNDSINGGADNDKLYGEAGNDTLWGGTGNDIFVYGSGEGKDVIADYAAGDTIKISNGTITATGYKSNDVVFTVGSGTLTVKNGKGKAITITDAGNKTSTKTYMTGVVYGTNAAPGRNSNTLWFTEDDTNFLGETNLDAISTEKYSLIDVETAANASDLVQNDSLSNSALTFSAK